MRMLINDEEDEEDDEDEDEDEDEDDDEEDDDVVDDDYDDDDDDDDVDAADDGDDDEDDDDEDDEDEEGEDEDENEDDDHPLPAGNLLSGGARGGPGGDRTWARQGGGRGGSNWKASRFPMVLLPAYSLLKQEQLQLAQLAFVTTSKTKAFCETSFKNGKLNAELTASYQFVLRCFDSICLKYCACHEKVMPGHTKCCTCHAKSSSQT